MLYPKLHKNSEFCETLLIIFGSNFYILRKQGQAHDFFW